MKKLLLILVAACTILSVSAQTTKTKTLSVNFDLVYKSEVSVGFAATGSHFKYVDIGPGYGGGGDTGIGYMPYDGTRAANGYSGVVHTVFSRAFVETIHGFQVGKYLFAGFGVGLQYYCGKLYDFQPHADAAAMLKGKSKSPNRWNALSLPIFVNARGMYPVKRDLIPFVNLGIGGTPVFTSAINYSPDRYTGGQSGKVSLRGGLYCDFGAGVRWKDYSLSIGLQHQGLKAVTSYEVGNTTESFKTKMKTNAFYVKASYHF